jgi:hypothetical protein
MTEQDTFAHDPQIQYMRRIFARIEKAQNILLEKISMTRFDERLRRFREMALKLFEKAWGMAMQRGIVKDEEDVAALYLYCLSYVLSSRGILVPSGVLPEHKEIQGFVKEVLK